MALTTGLSEADQTVQSMPDASPTKWHLAHTSWFFERVILRGNLPDYQGFDSRYDFLFNSYYVSLGKRHARPQRGLITRPTLDDVLGYRRHVDDTMIAWLGANDRGNGLPAEVSDLLTLGFNHEQQHQELMLTDLLHLFAQNPFYPAYRDPGELKTAPAAGLAWRRFDGGVVPLGHVGGGFSFDNETPRHDVLLRPFALANRLVTNGEWLRFMEEGGYERQQLWLSDGWATANAEEWQAPGYWQQDEAGNWTQMTLHGRLPIDPNRPVTHVSFYEADAYARWAEARLPLEAEWEHAASLSGADETIDRDYGPNPGLLAPVAEDGAGLQQLTDTAWQWTASPYTPYPGFRPVEGAVGEYNGKFMANQMVLRGSSCFTPRGHTRLSYRNFFYPHQRWQMTGLRLAMDV